jgi:hypothetical protein
VNVSAAFGSPSKADENDVLHFKNISNGYGHKGFFQFTWDLENSRKFSMKTFGKNYFSPEPLELFLSVI